MGELGLSVTNQTIAEHYGELLDAMLVHEGDPQPSGLSFAEADTLMNTAQDRHRVAIAAMDLAERLTR